MLGSEILKGENMVQVTLFKNNEQVRKVKLFYGEVYIINPLSLRVKKNRDRKVILKGIIRDRYGSMAEVYYTDTERAGKVELDYLDYIK